MIPDLPPMLADKKILIAITGSIAAYKIPLLVRSLQKDGAEVRVLMTTGGSRFCFKARVGNTYKSAGAEPAF
jgi:phosphopantothenoylcysteine decarboxylase/phosphopantothenate--cysteine ligase